MSCKLFPNPWKNDWIDKYNNLVLEIKEKEEFYKEYKKTQPKRNDATKTYSKDNVGIHHIIPKKVDPSLLKDPENLLYVPFDLHILLHYYLWKADYHYAPHLRFILAAARSWSICEIPGGEETWKEVDRDCTRIRKEKKQKKNIKENENSI